jgi:hypothetical protein
VSLHDPESLGHGDITGAEEDTCLQLSDADANVLSLQMTACVCLTKFGFICRLYSTYA